MKTRFSNGLAAVAVAGGCVGLFLLGFATAPGQEAQEAMTVVSSQAIARDIPTYVQEARSVVIGTVADVGQAYEVEGDANCETIVQRDVGLKVERVLRGRREPAYLTLAVEGGSVGPHRVVAEDEASFHVGERVLLFVGENTAGDAVVFAGAYGKLAISEDGETVAGNAGLRRPLAEVVDEILAAPDLDEPRPE